MPKDWFYLENHTERSFAWTLKKEDREDGTYDTGVKIQAFVGVEEATGKSPEKFVMDFFDQKERDADKIFNRCSPQDQELFTRVCLETQEGDFRILYSLFWGNDMDLVVVSIAGTKVEDWDQHSQTFESMSKFELIDMKRFK